MCWLYHVSRLMLSRDNDNALNWMLAEFAQQGV